MQNLMVNFIREKKVSKSQIEMLETKKKKTVIKNDFERLISRLCTPEERVCEQ